MALFSAFTRPAFADNAPIAGSSARPSTSVVEHDDRPVKLKAYLMAKQSPFADDAAAFVNEADRLGLNWKLVAAIAGVESTFGKHIPTGSYNAWGWGVFTGTNDGVHFSSWKDGIVQVSEGLKFRYIDKGAQTVEEIGRIYAASPTWSYKVKWMIADMENFSLRSQDSLAVTI